MESNDNLKKTPVKPRYGHHYSIFSLNEGRGIKAVLVYEAERSKLTSGHLPLQVMARS